MDVAFSASSSLDQELNANTGQDTPMFALSVTLMITYASVVASGGNWVSNRSHLACTGVLGVALAILASFGLLAAAGLKFVNIVGVMPFVALGVGVFSIFVIVSEWAKHKNKERTQQQVGEILKGCGESITIASLTDVIVFLIRATSSFTSSSSSNFCLYTGFALLFIYICHATFVLGGLALHRKRVRGKRHCVTCLETQDTETLKVKDTNGFVVCLCAGKPPHRREDDESICEKTPRLLSTRTILTRVCKVVVFVLFGVYLGFAIWGVINLQQGLVLTNLIGDTSYLNKYQKYKIEHFRTRFTISFVFENMDYLNQAEVDAMMTFLQRVQGETLMNNNSLLCWYHTYSTSAQFNNNSPSQFMTNLKSFLTYRPYLSNDVEFTADGSSIRAARCHLLTVDLPDTTQQGQLMLHLRQLADDSSLHVFPYTPPFIFFEQYVVILRNTLQTVGIAVVCMFVITVIFMPNPIMVALVTVNMMSILLGIFGFLYFWDLTLSSITMIHLIMSVSYSVDFSVHVCHGYMTSEKDSRDDKARDALRTSAAPVINIGLSSLIGIFTHVGNKSYVFWSFCKIMVLVISFPLAHSMLLLPVVLTLVGPMATQKKIHARSENKENIISDGVNNQRNSTPSEIMKSNQMQFEETDVEAKPLNSPNESLTSKFIT